MNLFRSIAISFWREKLLLVFILLQISACQRDNKEFPDKYPEFTKLKIKIKFDSFQERLDSYGNTTLVPVGHSALSTLFNAIYIKKIELLKDSLTDYGMGAEVFGNTDTWLFTDGTEIDQLISTMDAPGEYKWIRVYFYFQKFNLQLKANGNIYTGRLLSFLWPENYALSYSILDSSIQNSSVIHQGDWYLESTGLVSVLHDQVSGVIAEPNLLYTSWPVPIDKYIVTCSLSPSLVLDRPDERNITLSISTNMNLEWIEHSDPNYFEPLDGDTIFDFGVRGVKVIQ